MSPARLSPQSLGIVFAFFCLLLVGIMPVIANGRPEGTSSLTYALFLSLWQLIFSLPLGLREWRVMKAKSEAASQGSEGRQISAISRRHMAILAGSGLLFGVSTYFYILSAEKAGAIGAAIAIQAYPLFAILIEFVFLKLRKSAIELGFTLAMILAIVFLATNGTWQLGGVSYWFVFALSVPFIWSIAHISLRAVMTSSQITPGFVTFLRVLVSSVFLIGLQIGLEGLSSLVALLDNVAFQASAALMGFVYYSELFLWFHAAKRIDISLASSITAPSPAVTMIFAVTFLGDQVTQTQIIAFGVILVCLYGLIFANGRKTQRA